MIINKTKEKVLVHDVKVCSSIFSKAKGLMFSRKLKDSGLVFWFNSEKKRSLHMFFVFFPIDVLFLNSKRDIVEMKENFRPFTIYYPRQSSKYIIELPAGSIMNSKTERGDEVNFT